MSYVEHESFLLTVAQISLAVVGFSAIVSALTKDGDESRSSYERLLTNALVHFGLAVLLFALLPFFVAFFGISDFWISRFCNTALAAFIFSYFPVYSRRRAAVATAGGRSRRQWNFRVRLVFTYVIGLNAVGSGWDLIPLSAFASYSLGIGWLLFLAALGLIFTIHSVGR